MACTLTNARSLNGQRLDISIDQGIVTALEPAGPTTNATAPIAVDSGPEAIDLDGALVVAAPREYHAHLDKAYLAEQVPNPSGDLLGAIRAMERYLARQTVSDTAARAERAALTMARNGYVAVRTHVDVTTVNQLVGVEALMAVRERLADEIDIEIVALPGVGFSASSANDQRALLRSALDGGADIVGGCPHLEPDSASATDLLLDLATEYQRPVDLHTDETLDPAATGLLELVDAVEAGFELPVTASHCVSLGQCPIDHQHALAERVAAAKIRVVALPLTNLYLQGRDMAPTPRGIAPVRTLLSAGAEVAAGSDNLQDPFNPLGRASPFEIASTMMLATHVTADDAWSMIANPGGSPDIVEGMPADLIAIDAPTIRSAIAEAPAVRRWRSGVDVTQH